MDSLGRQACDDQACRIPQHASLKVTVPVGRLVAPNMGARMDGAEITSMDTGKYMLRMVRRGLLRSPIKGFRTLRGTLENVRMGPGGRRRGLRSPGRPA